MISIRSTDHVDYVLSIDPALDRDAPSFDWGEYMKSYDRKHAPTKDGCEPTVFKIKRLTRRQMLYVLKQSPAEQAGEAVAFGLESVKNLQGFDQAMVKRKRTDIGDRLDNETLD